MLSLKEIYTLMEEDSRNILSFRINRMDNIDSLDSKAFYIRYEKLMKYVLIQDSYIAILLLENYINRDNSVNKDILLQKIHNIILRTLSIYPIGLIDIYGHSEFGWKCYEPLNIIGALLLEENNQMFKSIMGLYNKTDFDKSLFSLDFGEKD